MLDTYQKIGYKLSIVFAVVAQSVEQRTENPCVDSSILSDGSLLFSFSVFTSLVILIFYHLFYPF